MNHAAPLDQQGVAAIYYWLVPAGKFVFKFGTLLVAGRFVFMSGTLLTAGALVDGTFVELSELL
jgi:hypothetical protein